MPDIVTTRIRAVVFDWAGTLLDHGSAAPAAAFVAVFAAHGVAVPPEQARGPMGIDKAAHLRALLAVPEIAEVWRGRCSPSASPRPASSAVSCTCCGRSP